MRPPGGPSGAWIDSWTLRVPGGVAHSATNVGEEDADMMIAYSPGVREFRAATWVPLAREE